MQIFRFQGQLLAFAVLLGRQRASWRRLCGATPAALVRPVTHTPPARQSDWDGRSDQPAQLDAAAKSP
jgi:hypothetical protein